MRSGEQGQLPSGGLKLSAAGCSGHKELYPKLTYSTCRTGSKEKGGAQILTHSPSHLSVLTRPSSCISKPPRVIPSLCPQDRALSYYPRPVTPTPDQILQAGPPAGSAPHRPNEETGKVAMQTALLPARASAPGPRPQGGTSDLPGEREGLPIHQAPFVSSSSSTLPPPIDLCCPLQVPRI